jgi:FtsZ-binding cell division protein ZapB
MSPAPRETSWVTDEETDEAYDTREELIEDERGRTQGRVTWQERLRKNFRELT